MTTPTPAVELCPGSDGVGWVPITPEMLKCPYCGYYTHQYNPTEHATDAAARQQELDAVFAELSRQQTEEIRRRLTLSA